MTNFVKTMYRVHTWKVDIEAVPIIKQTAQYVVHRSGHFSGSGTGSEIRERFEGTFFDTWQECRAYQIEKVQRSIERAKDQLQRARSLLGNWESLKEPS